MSVRITMSNLKNERGSKGNINHSSNSKSKKMKTIMPIIAFVAIMFSRCSKEPIEKTVTDKSDAWNQIPAATNGMDIIIRPTPLPILPILPDPTPKLPPGQTEYFVPNQAEFYNYVWGLPYGPAATCPYTSYSLKTVNVTFTNGSAIYCGPALCR